MKTSFDGIVIKKFIDTKEHSFPYIYIRNKNYHVDKLDLFYDSSAYKNIEINDSIVKFRDDPWIYKRHDQKVLRVAIITFGYKDSER